MKTMLVTGADNGIGQAIAESENNAGYRVGVLDLDLEAARQVAGALDHGVLLGVDVCDAGAVAAAIDELGEVHVLVNNAGILRTGPLLDHAVDDFRLVVDVNLSAVFIVAQAAARRKKRSASG